MRSRSDPSAPITLRGARLRDCASWCLRVWVDWCRFGMARLCSSRTPRVAGWACRLKLRRWVGVEIGVHCACDETHGRLAQGSPARASRRGPSSAAAILLSGGHGGCSCTSELHPSGPSTRADRYSGLSPVKRVARMIGVSGSGRGAAPRRCAMPAAPVSACCAPSPPCLTGDCVTSPAAKTRPSVSGTRQLVVDRHKPVRSGGQPRDP